MWQEYTKDQMDTAEGEESRVQIRPSEPSAACEDGTEKNEVGLLSNGTAVQVVGTEGNYT